MKSLLNILLLLVTFLFVSCDNDVENVSPTENANPVIANELTDLTLAEGFGMETINLSIVFSDADGDPLTYDATSSDIEIITVSVSGTNLTITEVGAGTATITVSANDQHDGTISDEFFVAINAEDNENCGNATGQVFIEEDGFLAIEAEDITITNADWKVENSIDTYSGSGYLVWRGDQKFDGADITEEVMLRYYIKINTPGTYRFILRCRIVQEHNGNISTSEHNDVFIKIEADDFFTCQCYDNDSNDMVQYYATGNTFGPDGTEKTPLVSSPFQSYGGFLKGYISETGWIWNTNAIDFGGRPLYATFNESGVYSFILARRSSGFAMDMISAYRLEDGTVPDSFQLYRDLLRDKPLDEIDLSDSEQCD